MYSDANGSYIELYSDDRCQALNRIATVAQVVPKCAAKHMSERFAPFVHGCATLLLTVGFVANTQVNSHLLGPSSPLKLLTTPKPQLKFVSVRVDETRREERKKKNWRRRKSGTVSPPLHPPIHRLSAVVVCF